MAALDLADARALGHELQRHLKEAPLAVPSEAEALLRGCVVGEATDGPDGVWLPPWRFVAVTPTEVELTWTIDLGHDSGRRQWFAARAARAPAAWLITAVEVGHADPADPAVPPAGAPAP